MSHARSLHPSLYVVVRMNFLRLCARVAVALVSCYFSQVQSGEQAAVDIPETWLIFECLVSGREGALRLAAKHSCGFGTLTGCLLLDIDCIFYHAHVVGRFFPSLTTRAGRV